MMSGARLGLEQVGVAALQLQVVLDRHLPADLRDAGDFAVLALEDREEAGLRRQSRDLDRVARGAAPAERARDEDVDVARAAQLHRALDLVLEVAQVGDRRGRDVGDLVRQRDQRRALALAEDVARVVADGLRRRRARGGRRGARALHAGVHVRLVVVTDVEHVVVALEHPGQAREADVDRAAVAALADHADVRRGPCTFSAAAMPVATAGALPNSEWIHGQLPRALGVRGREHLEAAGRVGGDQLVAGRAHRGVERVARAERLAAALAGAVAGGERVRALRVGLHGALLGIEQPVADHEASPIGRT